MTIMPDQAFALKKKNKPKTILSIKEADKLKANEKSKELQD